MIETQDGSQSWIIWFYEITKQEKFTYLSQKESFGNICGYFSTGCKTKFHKVLEIKNEKCAHEHVPLIGTNKHRRKYQVPKYSKHAQDHLFAYEKWYKFIILYSSQLTTKFQALAFLIYQKYFK